MTIESAPVPQYVPSSNRFPWGCLLGGCATVVLLSIGLIIAAGVGTYYFARSQIDKYTAESPRELPIVEYSPDEVKDITARVEAFKTDIEQGKTPKPISLTASDINGLISQNADLRGRLFVRVERGAITADVSLPLDQFPIAKGRYFNGSVTANVSLENGVLIVTLAEAEVNGQSIPNELMEVLKKENLAKDIYQDPEVAKTLSKFESLVIENDRIILTPKQSSP